MQDNSSPVAPNSNLAVDSNSAAEVPPEELQAKIEKDLLDLINNPRCAEGLKQALWKRVVDLRQGRGLEH